jgi:hypothetical protein
VPGATIRIPLKETDAVLYRLYTEPTFVHVIDDAYVSLSRDVEQHSSIITLQVPLDSNSAKGLDPDELESECRRSGNGAYCNNAAYALVRGSQQNVDDPRVYGLLRKACSEGSSSACIPIASRGEVETLCKSDTWACLRWAQFDLPAEQFMQVDHAVPHSTLLGLDPSVVGAVGFRAMSTWATAPTGLFSIGPTVRGKAAPGLWVDLDLPSFDFAFVPDRDASGKPGRWEVLSGAGVGLGVTVQFARMLLLDMGVTVAGYVNASASTATAWGGLRVLVSRRLALFARGGIARVPETTTDASGSSQFQGGTVLPMLGLGADINLADAE